ncbi:rhodanese-like domain-containing protein [Oscillatoria sp. FACHB-1407]|uniref:rhodanese-like domain-containing protein n=1 Tax=Oscillatoria sp. FACHB-1407 TaxID=2692847 RepID=UPI0016820C32|nr:rhodanese-like domain-containing protein [Oscillatoria sp. FACHB-1407]MBD2460927.1 rhodanese-like domain-containing protein [Oscillatoria sp. FACHB-1407]
MENIENLDKKVDDTVEGAVVSAKETVTSPLPKPPSLETKSPAGDLKNRLEWGEPALTIIDVRDRVAFNQGHIMGAVSMPIDKVAELAQASIQTKRDIYVYGDTDAVTAQAASELRNAGFINVAELEGGLVAWKEIGGPTEGTEEITHPGSDAYNVVSRLAHHRELQHQMEEQKQ